MKIANRVAIIGAGPAGIACAVQLKRSGIDPLIFEQGRIGGLLNNAYFIENYPGFPDGIPGHSLVKRFKTQMEHWQLSVIPDLIKNVRAVNGFFTLQAEKEYRVKYLVIASGTKPLLPKRGFVFHDKKIFYEIYPIMKKRKKTVVIVGSGDAAFDYALNLCRYNRVFILNHSRRSKALDLLQVRAKSFDDRITYLTNTLVKGIQHRCKGLSLVLSGRGKPKSIFCDYLIYAIGREPALDFLSSSMKKKINDRNGLFLIGDVKNDSLRQTAIAVGDGVKAAMEIVTECLRGVARRYRGKRIEGH